MRQLALGVFAVLCAAGISLPARTGQAAQVPGTGAVAAESDFTDLWFIELSAAPTAAGGNAATVRQEKQAFRAAAAAAGVPFDERRSFEVLFNGYSARLGADDVPRVARLPQVRAVYPVALVARPPFDEQPSTPDLQTATAMTGADIAQASLGLTGRGIRVAVMDSGIDYHHPDLGGCFGPGCRVAVGHDFVGDAFNGANTPVPDADPDDCDGHGTHVAGIVGADGLVRGLAPGVTFGAYRVFGCTGPTSADIMIAAMERALADGAHVLNMSIGAAFQWPQYPTAVAASRLVDRGVVVVASIGNSGATGVYSASAPGVGEKVIGVASFLNTHLNLTAFTISPDGRPIGFTMATAAPPPPASGTFALAATGTPQSTADGCTPLPAESLRDRVALIRRGTCGFFDKALHAQNAGAAAVVLYNNQPGLVSPTVAGAVPITIPVVAITAADGELIAGRLAAGAVSLTWTDRAISTPDPGGGVIDASSSYGLAPGLLLKPDLGAPGGNIRSTYPLELGAYNTISGTSMAAPHVAGAAALLLEARPRTPPQAVAGLLQNTAEPRPWRGNPGLGFLDQVHRQGAGMLRIDRAITTTTRVQPSRLSLGEGEAGAQTRQLRIHNDASTPVTYGLSHAPALATGATTADPTGTFAPGAFGAFAAVGFGAASITVPARSSATVDVTILPPATPARGVYGGYVVLTPAGGAPAARVPYAGFVGDYQGFPVLTPTPAGFPWLARVVGSTLVPQTAGAAFTMAQGDRPVFVFHIDHAVQRLRMEVVDAATGQPWHRALEVGYVGRNQSATAFYTVTWDGVTVNGRRLNTVPNGSYRMVLSIQKALGEDDNPAHWESWTSPAFTIARP